MTIDPTEAPCPTCSALVGAQCRTSTDHSSIGQPHRRRVTLAQTWDPPGTDPETGYAWAPWLRTEGQQIVVQCPFCAHQHRHGARPADSTNNGDGARVPHCTGHGPTRGENMYIVVGCPGVSASPKSTARWHGQRIRVLLADPDPDLEALADHWAGLRSVTRQGLPEPYRQAYRRLSDHTRAALTPAQLLALREATDRLAVSHAS